MTPWILNSRLLLTFGNWPTRNSTPMAYQTKSENYLQPLTNYCYGDFIKVSPFDCKEKECQAAGRIFKKRSAGGLRIRADER